MVLWEITIIYNALTTDDERSLLQSDWVVNQRVEQTSNGLVAQSS
jgi:hypothetical protein